MKHVTNKFSAIRQGWHYWGATETKDMKTIRPLWFPTGRSEFFPWRVLYNALRGDREGYTHLWTHVLTAVRTKQKRLPVSSSTLKWVLGKALVTPTWFIRPLHAPVTVAMVKADLYPPWSAVPLLTNIIGREAVHDRTGVLEEGTMNSKDRASWRSFWARQPLQCAISKS